MIISVLSLNTQNKQPLRGQPDTLSAKMVHDMYGALVHLCSIGGLLQNALTSANRGHRHAAESCNKSAKSVELYTRKPKTTSSDKVKGLMECKNNRNLDSLYLGSLFHGGKC